MIDGRQYTCPTCNGIGLKITWHWSLEQRKKVARFRTCKHCNGRCRIHLCNIPNCCERR